MQGGVDALPIWLQVLASILALIGAMIIQYVGYFKKKSDQPRDIAIPSLSILDAQTFRDATDTIKKFMAEDEERRRLVKDMQREQTSQTEVLRRLCDLSRQNVSLLESIDERLRERRQP